MWCKFVHVVHLQPAPTKSLNFTEWNLENEFDHGSRLLGIFFDWKASHISEIRTQTKAFSSTCGKFF
jgi:hypothetical protein